MDLRFARSTCAFAIAADLRDFFMVVKGNAALNQVLTYGKGCNVRLFIVRIGKFEAGDRSRTGKD